MRIFVGIDLGSTTTKAVVMTRDEEILGRGITNSRNNYDVACAIARSEALTTARFALLHRALAAEGAFAGASSGFLFRLEDAFRLEQHERQLASLAETCLRTAPEEGEREVLENVFEGMREEAAALFRGRSERGAQDFFRDLAASQFLRLAEAASKGGRVRFDRLMGIFDKSIHKVENDPPDLSFESNIRPALARTLAEAERCGGARRERAAAASGTGSARGGAMRGVKELGEELERAIATPFEEEGSVGTGYGRVRLPFPKDRIRSEILCHGLGAHYFFPATATVLDIGGQDTKAIQVDGQGLVTGFQMNDRCAAGCGRYLGYIADEMNLGVHELGPLAQQSRRPVRIASTCTVFAGAELRERLSLGEKREDILAGLHRAIILRSMSLLARSGGIRDEFTFTGGVARNPAALDALRKLVEENYGARTINISPDSIYTGAVGAALFARRGAAGTAEA